MKKVRDVTVFVNRKGRNVFVLASGIHPTTAARVSCGEFIECGCIDDKAQVGRGIIGALDLFNVGDATSLSELDRLTEAQRRTFWRTHEAAVVWEEGDQLKLQVIQRRGKGWLGDVERTAALKLPASPMSVGQALSSIFEL